MNVNVVAKSERAAVSRQILAAMLAAFVLALSVRPVLVLLLVFLAFVLSFVWCRGFCCAEISQICKRVKRKAHLVGNRIALVESRPNMPLSSCMFFLYASVSIAKTVPAYQCAVLAPTPAQQSPGPCRSGTGLWFSGAVQESDGFEHRNDRAV